MPILRNVANDFFAPLKTDFPVFNDDNDFGLINEEVVVNRIAPVINDPPP